MTAQHTPGPWLSRGKSDSVHSPSPTHPFGATIFQFNEDGSPSDADLALILAAPELLEALQAYQAAQAMSRFGDASDFVWPVQVMRYPGENSGGYLCPTHGLGYTSRCICCESDCEKHSARSDAKARQARDDALKAAEKSGLAAVAKATGAQA